MVPHYEPILVAEEIGHYLEGNAPPRDQLRRVTAYLRSAMGVDVCTIFRRWKNGSLSVELTEGLSESLIGKAVLHESQGLTGVVIRTRRPLPVRDGPSHPAFRYVPGLREEAFHSYLGVPLMNQNEVLGALVVQTREPRDFSREDIALLTNVSRLIRGTMVRLSEELEAEQPEKPPRTGKNGDDRRKIVTGRALAPGIFEGPPFVFDHGLDLQSIFTPASRGVEQEKRAIRDANRIVRREIRAEAEAVSGTEGQSVLMAHSVILEDPSLAAEVLKHIEEGNSAAESVRRTAIRWTKRLESIPDKTFAARAADFRDICNRLLVALGVQISQPISTRGKTVILARSLMPGELLRIGPDRAGALVMTDQGIHSHTAIIARSFNIPAVQVDPVHLDRLLHAPRLLVDGAGGEVVIEPTEEQTGRARERSEKLVTLPSGGPTDLDGPTRTVDGFDVSVGLNAGILQEFDRLDGCRPDSVGLYRTEMEVMPRETLPGLRQQMNHYRKVLARAGGRHVTFRTWDFGADKVPRGLRMEPEENPMMGHRSTRYMLDHTDLFRVQLKALLRVSAEGPMSILLPMISTPEELNLVLDEVNAIRNELDRSGQRFNRDVKIGVMLEVPSVLFQIDGLSRWSDFFCVGTNDLVQYLMAADRSNSKVTRLYQWHHPAILVALDRLLQDCKRNRRPVTLCGEMAGHPWAAMLLVGMGYDHLSTGYHSLPVLKWTLRQGRFNMMHQLSRRAIRASSSAEVIEIFYSELPGIREECPPLARLLEPSLERLRANALW